jgi:hypothetical protein
VNHIYVYARVGQGDRVETLRYLTEVENTPVPGADVATTPAVGVVVAHSVLPDAAGNTVVLALDPTPTTQDAGVAKSEGWEVVPDDDPLRADIPGATAET